MQKSHYSKTDPVCALPLDSYSYEGAKAALAEAMSAIGADGLIKTGMTVVIKANLVSAMKPEEAATTHPTLLSALTDILVEKGAKVLLGDSPGGMYNSVFVGRVYKQSGMHEVESHGAELNMDFTQKSAVYEEARVLHTFTYTTYLDRADLIINFCKLKSHGMMGMSCAAKNMFGAVPGIIKPEYHYRFPDYRDFANMLLDLDEYFHPEINLADAVIGMEGNGPTAGTPKQLGFILASRSPHTLDMLAAKLIGLDPFSIPTLAAARERELVPESIEELKVIGDPDALCVEGFKTVLERSSLGFSGNGKNPIKRIFGKIAGAILKTRPVLKKDLCVGCGVCKNICPAKAIVIEDDKAIIDRKSCIRCFCCQEFCPKSAMKVKRTFIASVFHSEKKKK